MKKVFRHGDVLVERVDSIPEGLVKEEDTILLEGEASGHFHVLSKGSEVFKVLPTKDNNYLLGYFKTEEGALLTHNEHQTIEIPAGTYKFYAQREYDEQEERQVRD